MQLRWTHDGVSLRAPVRFAGRLRTLSAAALGFAGIGTLALLGALQPAAPPVPYGRCAAHASAPFCADLVPSWKTWDFPDRQSWRAARMCALLAEDVPRDLTALEYVDPRAGVSTAGNLEFLGMVARQAGNCDEAALPGPARPYAVAASAGSRSEVVQAARAHADREGEVLRVLEAFVFADRAARAQRAETERFVRQTRRAALLGQAAWAWVPALILAWISLLVGVRRVSRAARPLALDVGPAGVRVDDRWIARSEIAWLALDGQRLRVERWSRPAVLSRPLPLEALAHIDEICGAVMSQDPSEPVIAPVPAALSGLRVAAR